MPRPRRRSIGLVALLAALLLSGVVGTHVLSLRSAADVVVDAVALECAEDGMTFEDVPFLADAPALPDEDEDEADDGPREASVPGSRLDLADGAATRCVLTLGVRNDGGRAVTLVTVDAGMWAPGDASGWPIQADEEAVGSTTSGSLATSEDATDARYAFGETVDADSSTTVQVPFVQRPGACLGPGDVVSSGLTARLGSWWWATSRTIDVTVAATSGEGLGDC